MPNISLSALYLELMRDYMSAACDESEMLGWMMLIHTHEIRVSDAVPTDPLQSMVLLPATQRTAARLAAELWSNRDDAEKNHYVYWYREYQLKTPYESMAAVPRDKRLVVERLRKILENDPRVSAIVPT